MDIKLKTFIANNSKTGCKLYKNNCLLSLQSGWHLAGILESKKTYEPSSIFILALCLGALSTLTQKGKVPTHKMVWQGTVYRASSSGY